MKTQKHLSILIALAFAGTAGVAAAATQPRASLQGSMLPDEPAVGAQPGAAQAQASAPEQVLRPLAQQSPVAQLGGQAQAPRLLAAAAPAAPVAQQQVVHPAAQERAVNTSGTKPTVLVGNQPVVIAPGADPALVATQAWARTGRGQVIMQDDMPLFPYGLSRPSLVCAPGYVCAIHLESGEIPVSMDVGSPEEWQVAPRTYGKGNTVISVRALTYTGESTLLIATNKRAYQVKLKASKTQYTPAIGFYFPKEQLATWTNNAYIQQQKQDDAQTKLTALVQQMQQLQATKPASGAAAAPAMGGDDELPQLTAADLNFRYYQEGRDYDWKPVRVYDDGKKTYIEMNPRMQVSQAPALVLIDSDGREAKVDYRVKGNYFIVDRLFQHAALLNGVGRGADRIDIYAGEQRRKLFGVF